ncbi:5'-methylthioadenosine/adenosylhomocysteine nucleosidase [Clostridium grantii]|uniref:adenosylhomocysteine nucleosidase n=1 Tax=Clostridium grantii DSM 8605 TaxID=1121316 RepID=A0A1M5SH43_9CLOT|nr:5'-methylthioadenosine/adenosylhomocysteine nucleosidase [Clostridium grantii]SHH37811.1 methylthioadenosine nucleosidase [Clostridium grantii DSM 8605]
MRIGIIGAMDEEVSILLQDIELEKKITKAGMEFNLGKLYSKNVVVVKSGIGKVNAAVCTQILIDDYAVDSVINIGAAGGIGEEVLPGDVVIATSLIHHDMDVTAFGTPIGQIPRMDCFDFKSDEKLLKLTIKSAENIKDIKIHKGIIVSGDQFIDSVEKVKWFSEEFHALACEMESASIAQVCYLNNKAFVIIRSISDNACTGAHMDFNKFVPLAVKNSSIIIKNLLPSI